MSDATELPDTTFSLLDYVLFCGCLLVSAAIGVYYAFLNRKQESTNELLLGSRQLSVIPVAMTLVASFISAISILGYPAEIYQFGTMFCWYLITYCIVYPVAAFLYVPVFYNLRLTSAYEYLELRFDCKLRVLASGLFGVQVLLYMAVVLYAPAIALSSVFHIPVYVSILATGLVSTFYTSLGGARAVVWTNTFQVVLILFGLLAVIISGSIQLGGIGHIWDIAENGDRLVFDELSTDPRVRHSVWSLTIGGTTTVLSLYAANQMSIQRLLSLPTLRGAQCAVLINIPSNMLSLILYTLVGLTMFAAYFHCDPRTVGAIHRNDQACVVPIPDFIVSEFYSVLTAPGNRLVAFYVVDRLRLLIGVPGLFVAALYSAGLSTLAGGFNALSAVALHDFVKPAYKWRTGGPLEDKAAVWMSKFLAVIFGLVSIGIAFLLGFVKTTVLQSALSIFGMIGGPLLGLFTLGMFFPWANSRGALAGLICSVLVTFWIGFGAIFSGVAPLPLLVSTDDCSIWNLTHIAVANSSDSLSPLAGDSFLRANDSSAEFAWTDDVSHGMTAVVNSIFVELYKISYQFYSTIGVLIVLFVGLLVSFISGPTKPKDINPLLLVPIYRVLCCCLPLRWQSKLKCGVLFDATNTELIAAKNASQGKPVKGNAEDLLRKYHSIDEEGDVGGDANHFGALLSGSNEQDRFLRHASGIRPNADAEIAASLQSHLTQCNHKSRPAGLPDDEGLERW